MPRNERQLQSLAREDRIQVDVINTDADCEQIRTRLSSLRQHIFVSLPDRNYQLNTIRYSGDFKLRK